MQQVGNAGQNIGNMSGNVGGTLGGLPIGMASGALGGMAQGFGNATGLNINKQGMGLIPGIANWIKNNQQQNNQGNNTPAPDGGGGNTTPGGQGTNWDNYWQSYWQHNPYAYSFQGAQGMNPYGNYSPYGMPMGGAYGMQPGMGMNPYAGGGYNPYGQGGWNQQYNPMGGYQMNYYKMGGRIGGSKKKVARELASAEIEGGETVVTLPEKGQNYAIPTDNNHKMKQTSDYTAKAIGPNHAKASSGKEAGS
jgi:hypothetical protein